MSKTASPKRTGRPPSGPDGALVSKYAQVTVRLPPATRHQLQALSVLRGVPVWQLVDQAVLALIEQLPAAEQKLLRQFTARRTA
jgi:hypothetical protein